MNTRKQIGVKLFNLALAWSKSMPGTLKAKREEIKSVKGRKKIINGSKSADAAMQAVETAANEIIEARKSRLYIKLSANLGYCPINAESYLPRKRQPTHGTQANKRIPSCFIAPIAFRLSLFKKGNFKAYLSGYRFDQTPEVSLTNDPAAVGVYQSDYLDWDYYSKATKYPKKIINTTIRIPASWGSRVRKLGLAEIGGMVTLDAQRLEGAPEGIKAYAVTWLEQGRGYELHTVNGYVAIAGDTNYHAPTFDAAVKGVMRKAKISAANKAFENLLTKHGIESLAQRCPDIIVTVDDAKKIGACDYGIRSWCGYVGIDYSLGKATLTEAYAAYLKRPMPEARAAILHALKRNKRTVLKSA